MNAAFFAVRLVDVSISFADDGIEFTAILTVDFISIDD